MKRLIGGGGTGTVSAAGSGTAAAPGIAFASDPNTGIYSPGADQLAVATNGVGRLFVDASGNVGVGTSPGAQLDILSSGFSNLRVRSSAANSATINLTNSARNYSFNTNSGDFYIRDESAVAERLRVTSAGLVGIGTSAPDNSLHVVGGVKAQQSTGAIRVYNPSLSGTNAPEIQFSQNATSGEVVVGYIQLSPVDRSGNYYSDLSLGTTTRANEAVKLATLEARNRGDVNSYIKLNVDGTNAVHIDGSRRVGIGTTSPSGKLTVDTGNAATNAILVGASAETGRTYGLGVNASAAFVIHEHTAASDRLVIDSSGRLLVGTSTARQTGGGFTAQSQVEGSTTVSASSFTITSNRSADDLGPRLNFARSKGGAIGSNTIVDADAEYGGIYFFGADGTDTDSIGAQISAYVDGTPGANDMPGRLVFSTTADGAASPTERMRISSSGNVGIGTTSAGTKLEVNSGSVDVAIVTTSTDSGSYIGFQDDSTTSNTTVRAGAIANDLVLWAGSSERARIDSSGRLLVGTSSSSADSLLVVEGNAGSGTTTGAISLSRGSLPVGSTSGLGSINFTDNSGNQGAQIIAIADGAWTSGSDHKSRLVFSTTADGASSPTERLRITSAGVLQIADAGNITVGTTTGTKIGTATTQKLGFYNATPVVQPTAVADATDAATAITQLNDLLAKLRTLGIIAT
jgi:hypothetical protein